MFLVLLFFIVLQKSLKINLNSKLIAQLSAKTVWFAFSYGLQIRLRCSLLVTRYSLLVTF